MHTERLVIKLYETDLINVTEYQTIYVICVCLVRLYLQLFLRGLMSYLRYLWLFGSSLPPVVSKRAHVLFTF
jgi:hypothetical protein